MDSRLDSLEQKIGSLGQKVDSLEARMDDMHNDLNQNFEQMMNLMRGIVECDKSSLQVPRDNGKAHTSTATYAHVSQGAIGSRLRELESQTHRLTVPQTSRSARFERSIHICTPGRDTSQTHLVGQTTYRRDLPQRIPIYVERPPAEGHIKLDMPDYFGTMEPKNFLD